LTRYSTIQAAINKLVTHCLLFAAQNGNCIIDDRMMKKVIEGELA